MPKPAPASTGVIVRDAHLQIDLRRHGFGKERLELAPTPTNIRYAEKLRNEILGKIERGTFALADYFPDSPRAKTDAPSMTFAELAIEWMKIKRPTVQHSTAHHYDQTVNSLHFASVRSTRMADFDYRRLMALLAGLPANAKTFNNVASVLKQMLTYAHKAKLLREPLHEHVEMRRAQHPGPDPFSLDEAGVLLAKLKGDRARSYYEFAFFTGLRPSEQIALRWSNVDLRAGTVLVDTALTRGKEKGTKTGETRTLELTSRARVALERQRPITQLAGAHVFVNDAGSAFESTDGPLDDWWKPAMKLSGLRQRDARQTRHTYATTCLMAGIAPGWVARQLGHAPEMFFRVYSRWIEGADKGAERRKLDAFLGAAQTAETGTKTGTAGPNST
ncbi:tyrosine-type recombinase/integrase [Variovorax sp. PBL-E5]|uniref:tyrosine-type recombinase/integrase n=1 Tax=Variovorax sp. PBL-E5 TaxID=434014 RepID=UPI00131890E7|nr:site-specific integrase [Variovorax sp. PBL-E5]VTU37177.1 site-specific tyrosine recombinase XerC [Variovorax sp. PBL-E5]